MQIQQEIPQAPEIETAVLGALLLDNSCIAENIDKIQTDFFSIQLIKFYFLQ